jgi:hypothetical protein
MYEFRTREAATSGGFPGPRTELGWVER